jgi:hypothetical protein
MFCAQDCCYLKACQNFLFQDELLSNDKMLCIFMVCAQDRCCLKICPKILFPDEPQIPERAAE